MKSKEKDDEQLPTMELGEKLVQTIASGGGLLGYTIANKSLVRKL